MVKGKTSLLHGVSDGHSLEISTVVYRSGFSVDQRVVSGWWGDQQPKSVMKKVETYWSCTLG